MPIRYKAIFLPDSDDEDEGNSTGAPTTTNKHGDGDSDKADDDEVAWDHRSSTDHASELNDSAELRSGVHWLDNGNSGDEEDDASDVEADNDTGASEAGELESGEALGEAQGAAKEETEDADVQTDGQVHVEDEEPQIDENQAPSDDLHGESHLPLNETPPKPDFEASMHACQNPPRFLYRVDHEGVHSIRDRDGTIRARVEHPDFDDEAAFTTYVANHFVWGCRVASPFMSTFSHVDSAFYWVDMIRLYNSRYDIANFRVFVVDTKLLDNLVFYAHSLATRFDVRDPTRTKPLDHTSEYLITGSIPAYAIVNTCTWIHPGTPIWENNIGL